jgi:serine/threonine protein kinase
MTEPNSHQSSHCPACRETLPIESPQGLCPACLMAGALDTMTDPDTTAGAPCPAGPDIEAIRSAFPQFEIIEFIGAGGMGSVYKARQPQLDRIVALKILTVAEKDSRFTERFQQEAKTLARLSHPNIVTVFDYGEANGLYFLLMEFVEGLNLRQIMSADRLAPEQALAIVPPICEALQYAHDQGIVHRDIKPDNILMDQSGRVKIADFGIARLLENVREEEEESAAEGVSAEPTLTNEMVLGTPNYMAPEQEASPGAVDHRADIYSLGVVFYEMLTGERPDSTLTPPSQRVEVDVRLDEVVLRALAKQPEMRFQSAHEFTRSLVGISAESTGEREPAKVPPLSATSWRSRLIEAGAALLVFAELAIGHGLWELLLMTVVGSCAFFWFSRKPIPHASAFSKTARVLLTTAAFPVVFFIVGSIYYSFFDGNDGGAALNELTPPESRSFTLQGQTVIAVDDGLRTHYVFHLDSGIDSVRGMSQGGGKNEPQHWSRNGTLALPSGDRIAYERDSSNLAELKIDGRAWDLRKGAVFHIDLDGTINQWPLYPPLIRDENLAEWIETIADERSRAPE